MPGKWTMGWENMAHRYHEIVAGAWYEAELTVDEYNACRAFIVEHESYEPFMDALAEENACIRGGMVEIAVEAARTRRRLAKLVVAALDGWVKAAKAARTEQPNVETAAVTATYAIAAPAAQKAQEAQP